jgi:hypothetical protein
VFGLNWVLMGAAVAITLWTGVEYLWKGLRAPHPVTAA